MGGSEEAVYELTLEGWMEFCQVLRDLGLLIEGSLKGTISRISEAWRYLVLMESTRCITGFLVGNGIVE